MPKEFERAERVAEVVRRGMAEVLAGELDDPRLARVTITDLLVSRDLRHANVFVTSVDAQSRQQQDDIVKLLRRASGYLRRCLARTVELRRCPELHFEYDHNVQRGAELTALIDSVSATLPPAEDDDR